MRMTESVSDFALQLADREAIRHCLYRFCRGVDRVDMDLVKSAFWPDATAEYGNFDATSASDFLEKSLAVLKTMEMTSHELGNILIEIDGNTAYVEAYVRAVQMIPKKEGGGTYDYVSASRYLDRFEKRDDKWRIKHRMIVRDWFREYPDSFDWETGKFPQAAGYTARKPLRVGQRMPDDLSYQLFEPKSE